MATDLQRARAAKESFKALYGDEPTIVGIGLANGADGYEIRVNLSRPGIQLPRSCNGCLVTSEVVGEVSAF